MTLRTTRAGTRNLAREEIKRVKKSLEKVRRWEKKWVVLEESGLKVFRWVPKPVGDILCSSEEHKGRRKHIIESLGL